jgi:hypothetical protein
MKHPIDWHNIARQIGALHPDGTASGHDIQGTGIGIMDLIATENCLAVLSKVEQHPNLAIRQRAAELQQRLRDQWEDEPEDSPLRQAAKDGNEEEVRRLLAEGSMADDAGKFGRTAT